MTTSDDRALALLQALMTIYRDTAEVYAAADRELPDPEIGRELEGYAQQRVKLMKDIGQRVRELRGNLNGDAGSAAAANGRARASGGDELARREAILSTLERSEDVAVDALRRALQERDIDAATRRLFERHYELVQAAHDRIRQLRDRARSVSNVG